MRALLVAGARPNFMKIAPIITALRDAGATPVLVHTGQHYDYQMSGAFFEDLGLPEPDHHLNVGSGTHAVQTAQTMIAFEPVLRETAPDWVVVVGDVNATLACALVASKLKEETGARIAHVEAGLRSGDWRMPEEVNRVLTDRLSDLLLTHSRSAHEHLRAEGIPESRVVFVGNVMIDTLLAQLPKARARNYPEQVLGLSRDRFVVVTLHRPSNVDDCAALRTILTALSGIAETMPVVIPMHPRTRKNVEACGLHDEFRKLTVLEPLGYFDMLSLVDAAAVVLTDSGGLQEETTALGVRCITLREQTERPITVEEGTNRMCPWPLSLDGIQAEFARALEEGRGVAGEGPEGWDGWAATRAVAALVARS